MEKNIEAEAQDCLFCKIIKGEIPSYKIYEDKYCFAFLDIAGDYEGHTLVVPKSHTESLLTANYETLTACACVCQKIARHYVQNCGYEGVNILTNANECAEQSVMHLHYHIIPRKNKDNLKIYPTRKNQGYDLEKLCEKLKMADVEDKLQLKVEKWSG